MEGKLWMQVRKTPFKNWPCVASACAEGFVNIYIHTYEYTHTHIYIYIYIYICLYVCVWFHLETVVFFSFFYTDYCRDTIDRNGCILVAIWPIYQCVFNLTTLDMIVDVSIKRNLLVTLYILNGDMRHMRQNRIKCRPLSSAKNYFLFFS